MQTDHHPSSRRPGAQVIVTTVFGAEAEDLEGTFSTFLKVPDCQLHAYVYGERLPKRQVEGIHYHLVPFDPAYTSVRRDALFRRWLWPDELGAEFALVVDGTDVLCLQPIAPFSQLLRGASVAAAPEWMPVRRLAGLGYTCTYLNAGVTFWDLRKSRPIRHEIAQRGKACYRGPFDDQTVLNELLHAPYFDELVILPPQYNWRAHYRKSYRTWRNGFQSWPRLDRLDGVILYHNKHCLDEVRAALSGAHPPAMRAALPEVRPDERPLGPIGRLTRRLLHRWQQ